MRRVYCCDLLRYRWTERDVRGEPPSLPEARRNLDCFLDGKKLIVFGRQHCSAELYCMLSDADCLCILGQSGVADLYGLCVAYAQLQSCISPLVMLPQLLCASKSDNSATLYILLWS